MKKILATAALLALAGAAQAQLSYTGAAPITFSDYTSADILGTGAVSAGVKNALINAGVGGTLTVTFLGKEASHHNNYTFTLGNLTTLTIDNGSPVPTSVSGVVGGGALNFTFKDLSDGDTVINGGAVQSGYASYALLGSIGKNSIFTPNTAGGAYTYVLGFNDGSAVDADFDDLVIGIKLTPAVPEPGTYALMFAGLAAMAFVARRRKQA